MKTETLTAKLTFTEQVLGIASGNPEVHAEFIASKAPKQEMTDEEVAAIPVDVEAEVEKASTVWMRDEKGLFAMNYCFNGLLKEMFGLMLELGDMPSAINRYNLSKAVDLFVRVSPRRIYFHGPDGAIIQKPSGTLQRPLRARTLQGDRICLARSETIDPGASVQFTYALLIPSEKVKGGGEIVEGPDGKPRKPKTTIAVLRLDHIRTALDLAGQRGTFQWRSGGHGAFTWEEINTP